MRSKLLLSTLALAGSLFGVAAGVTPQAQTLTVIAFNTESGGADPGVIADTFENLPRADVWGFSEVQSESWANTFEEAVAEVAGSEFQLILGSTGGGDRLAIIYNADTLELVSDFELHDINIGGNVRAPLVGRFRMNGTPLEFFFVVNHLYRSRPERRHQQATLLNEWAATQTIPVVMAGDFNFDWSVADGDHDHDTGFDNLTAGAVMQWVRPNDLVRTQCSSFDSVLDFVFVGGEARNWSGSGDILFREASYCPDDNTTSDHRPVSATFTLAAETSEEGLRALILQRIELVEHELEELRRLVQELGGGSFD